MSAFGIASSWMVLAMASAGVAPDESCLVGVAARQAAAAQAAPDQASDKPIIPDADFQKDLPPLSGDINAPLEPMPAWTAQSIQPPGTSSADALPPPPPEAPELAQPLPPLATFDSTPPATIADIKDDKSPEIRYDTVVKGLDDVDLTGKFNGLSALKDGDGKAANSTMVTARAHEDEALAVRLMKSLGYYDGTAVSTIETIHDPSAPDTPGRVRATIDATTGKQYKLGSITVKTQATVPADLVRNSLPLEVCNPIEAARIEGAEANVSLMLPQQGYPFVKVGDRDILLDDVTTLGDYTLPVDTGPRSSFGGYSTDGKLAFDAHHVGVLARFKPGELYDNRKVDDLRNALVATGLFTTVAVEPVRTGNPGPDGTEQIDLLVHQTAGPPRSLAASGGYSTGEGFKIEGSFTHRNAFPPEGALIGTVIAGSQEQGLTGSFRRSNAGKRDKTVSLTAGIDHSNYDAFNAFTATLAGRISYDSTPLWQKRFTYAYGFELTGTNESVYDFDILDRRRATYFIAALPGQAQWDTTDSLLNPTKGYRVKLNLSPETSVKGAVSPYVRTLAEVSGYYPVSHSVVLAGRVRGGSILGIDRDDLAPSRRYYGGGGGSVRGYGYQRLGPFDPNGDPVGGRSLNEFSVEARYRFGDYGVVPFFDGGNAYESSFPKGSDLRYGVGIGGRLYTNFGPLRIDVATPLNPRKGDGKVALYLSIGQAF